MEFFPLTLRPPTPSRPKGNVDPAPISYGINAALFDASQAKWTTQPNKLIAFAAAVDLYVPGKTVVFRADALSTNHVVLQFPGPSKKLGTHDSREKINVLFADWHAATMSWEDYSDNVSASGKAQWSPMAAP